MNEKDPRYVEPLDRDEIIEQLYNLDRLDLRRVAWEALLISDGPDHIEGTIEHSKIEVSTEKSSPRFNVFIIYEREQWSTS